MADLPPPTPGALRGEVLFYSNPEPLNNSSHLKLGLRRIDRPFLYARDSQVVPLTVTEFPLCSVNYPIIFAGDRKQPLAVVGVNQVNMFITEQGFFEPGAYVPAYVRRYPFVLAKDDTSDQLVVCVDVAAKMVGDLPDIPFFDPNGQPTDYTKSCIQFCNDYEVEVRRTESYIELLNGLDLFHTRQQTFTQLNPDGTPGQPQQIAEFFAIDEEKLKALPADKLKELMDNGAMTQIYAHLLSLNNWDKLMNLAIARQGPPQAANLN